MELFTSFLSSIVVFSLSGLICNSYFGLSGLAYYWPYYIVGYVLAKFAKHQIYPKVVATVLLFLILSHILIHFDIVQIDASQVDSFLLISVVFLISVFLAKHSECGRLKSVGVGLAWMGRNSLPIYLFQLAFLNIGIGTGFLRMVTIFISATACSIAMTLLVRRIRVLSVVFLGEF